MPDRIEDPELGSLVWSKDERAWLSDPEHQGIGFIFHIAGIPVPDEALLMHAKEIMRNKREFVDMVTRFLHEHAEKVRFSHHSWEEISGLRIECVCLSCPERPNDGMVYFEGGHEYRLWRCDYINRCPKGLAFDS